MRPRLSIGFSSLLLVAALGLVLSCNKDRLSDSQPARLALSTHEAIFSANAGGSNPPSQNVQVSNAGSGELKYQMAKKEAWLMAQALGTAPGDIVLACFVGTLPTGVYHDTVVVTATTPNTLESPQRIAVTFTVKGAMAVAPVDLRFAYTAGGVTPPSETVVVTSPGGGALDFTVSDTVRWLKVTPLNGTSPDTVLVELDTVGGINQGIYYSYLPILSDQAANSPYNIPCSLLVDAWLESDVGENVFDLRTVHAVDAEQIWAVGFRRNDDPSGEIFRSTDSGKTWQWLSSAGASSTSFGGIDFVGNIGVVVGDNGVTQYTTNGGANWTKVFLDDTTSFWQVDLISVDSGWTVGTKGAIMRTVNGGQAWSPQSSGVSTALSDVNFVDNMSGWTVGNNGVILHTSNAGADWLAQSSGSSEDLWGLSFVNSMQGWVCGADGTILHTTNGGTDWIPQTTGSTADLRDIYFVDVLHGWAVGAPVLGGGEEGTILYTEDGGNTWIPLSSQVDARLYGVHFLDARRGWVVGESFILSTINGGR